MLPEKESMTVIIGVSAAINFSVTLKTETRSVIVSVRKADIIIMIIRENTSSIIPYSFFSLTEFTIIIIIRRAKSLENVERLSLNRNENAFFIISIISEKDKSNTES